MIKAIIIESNFYSVQDCEYSFFQPDGTGLIKEIIEYETQEEFDRVKIALEKYGPKEDGYYPMYKLVKIVEPTEIDFSQILKEACDAYDKNSQELLKKKKRIEASLKKKAEEKKKKEALKKVMDKLTPEELEKIVENIK